MTTTPSTRESNANKRIRADDMKIERQNYYHSNSFIGITNPAIQEDGKTKVLVQRASHQTFKDIPMNGTFNDCIENELLSKWSRKMLIEGGEERQTVLFRPLYNNESIISGVFTLRYGLFLANSFPLDMIKTFVVLSGGVQIQTDVGRSGIAVGEQASVPPQQHFAMWNDPPNSSAKVYCVMLKA